MNNYKKYFQVLFSQTKEFVFFIMFSLLSALLIVFETFVIKYYIDDVITGGNHQSTSLCVTFFIIGFALFIVSIVLKSKTKTVLTSNVIKSLAVEAYDAVLYADISEIESDQNDLMINNILINSEKIGNQYLRKNFLKMLESTITVVILFFAMLFIKPILSLFVMVALPIYFVVSKATSILINKVKKQNNKCIDNINDIINEDYYNARTIKLLNSVESEKANFDSYMNDFIKSNTNKFLATNIFSKALLIVFNVILIAIILGLSGFLSSNPKYGISGGLISIYLILVPFVFITFNTLINCNINTNIIDNEINELELICSLRTEKKTEPINTLDEVYDISFKDVSYMNDNNEVVVKDISFDLRKGEKLCILTTEEETKTAIFDMVTKLVKPRSGEIAINNCDISRINTSYLRSIVTSIFDHEAIINDSIKENVIYPLAFDDYKFNDAMYKSGLKDLINHYYQKENTNVFDKEIDNEVLYRIIFANAFFKDSKIYLYKDFESGINSSIEMEMMDQISKLKNKLVITITDKALYLNKFEKILIIKNGEMVEFGTYEELSKNKNSEVHRLIMNPSSVNVEKIS